MTTPMNLAAERILATAPTAARIARGRGWLDEAGQVDWQRIDTELPQMEYLSGGERRLLEFTLRLQENELYSADPEDGRAVAAALRAAADDLDERANMTTEWMARHGLQ